MKYYFEKRIAIGIFCAFLTLILLFFFPAIQQATQPIRYIGIGAAAICLTLMLYLFYDVNLILRQAKKTDARLNKYASEIADLYDNAPCGYLSVDPERNITKINHTLLTWLGYTFEEVVGKLKFEDFLSLESRPHYLESFGEIFKKYKRKGSISDREFYFLRKDRSVFNVALSSIGIYADNGSYLEALSTVVDSTERKKAEQKILDLNQSLEAKVLDRTHQLAESEKIYRSLAANIPGSAITLLDRDERYMLAEGELLAKMGYTKKTMPGLRLSDVITPENYEFYGPLMKRAFSGEMITMEKRTLSGFDTIMTMVPLKNEREEIFAVMFVYIDISDVKKTQQELVKLNNTLEDKVYERTSQLKELNDELEAFTYSVSHDLRTPLRAISGYAQMLKEDYITFLDSEGDRILYSIISNAVRMGKLIDDLLEFSRLGRKPLAQTTMSMDNLVAEVISELTVNQQTRKINFRVSPLKPVTGDRNMLKQVWINLISNALKYSSKKDVSSIAIWSSANENEITYFIQDNGVGFDMEYAAKLFTVFQRLHRIDDFEGTGVGLALIKTIIKKHGGTVGAEAKLNHGSTFFFSLPAHCKTNEINFN